MDDEQVMRQLSSGNDSAFDVLVFRYHQSLFGYVYRLIMDKQMTEDIVQETFFSIYQQGQKGNLPEKFKPWMYRIASNACKDHLKKASTRKELLSGTIISPYENQVVQIIDKNLERQWLLEALGTLPLEYRMTLYLRFYQDMKYEDIATALEIPVNTVKTRVARGLQKLEGYMTLDHRKEMGSHEISRKYHR